MIEIGGLSGYKMVGDDTIKGRGASLKKFPVAKGRKPYATNTVITKPINAFEITWVDTRGKKRYGVIRVKKRKEIEA